MNLAKEILCYAQGDKTEVLHLSGSFVDGDLAIIV